MFIIQLTNGNFALMQSHFQSEPIMIAEYESYDAAMEMKLEYERK